MPPSFPPGKRPTEPKDTVAALKLRSVKIYGRFRPCGKAGYHRWARVAKRARAAPLQGAAPSGACGFESRPGQRAARPIGPCRSAAPEDLEVWMADRLRGWSMGGG